jgi:hypothetical protein
MYTAPSGPTTGALVTLPPVRPCQSESLRVRVKGALAGGVVPVALPSIWKWYVAPAVASKVLVVGGDQAQVGEAGAGVDREDRIEALAGEARLEAASGGRGPAVPEGFSPGEAEDARLPRLERGGGVGGVDPRGTARDDLRAGEGVVGRDRPEVEQGESRGGGGPRFARDHDLVGDPSLGLELQPRRHAAGLVIVGGHRGEGSQLRTGEDAEEGVVTAAGGREAHPARGRRDPLPPQGGHGGLAGDARLVLEGRAEVDVAHRRIASGEAGASGEVVVERPVVGGAQRPVEVQAAPGLHAPAEGGDRIDVAQNAVDQLAVGVPWKLRPQEREGTGDVRGRHRRAGTGGIGRRAGWPRRPDLGTRGEQLDRARAEVGAQGGIVAAGGVGDGNHVFQPVAGRVMREQLHVRPVVAGGRHEEDPRGARPQQGLPLGRIELGDRPGGRPVASVDDARPVADRVVDALDAVGGGAPTRAGPGAPAEELQAHQLHPPRDARDADAVIADRPDDARDMRAVAKVVGWVTRTGDRVDAVDVVDVPVAVVVASVAGNFSGVDPEVGGEIGVVRADARVDHGDDDFGGVRAQVPSPSRTEVGAGDAVVGAGVPVRPLAAGEIRIVGYHGRLAQVIALDVLVATGGGEAGDGGGNGFPGGELQEAQAVEAVPAAAHADALAPFGRVRLGVAARAWFGEDNPLAIALCELSRGEPLRARLGGRQREDEQEGQEPVPRGLQGAGRLGDVAAGRQAGARRPDVRTAG